MGRKEQEEDNLGTSLTNDIIQFMVMYGWAIVVVIIVGVLLGVNGVFKKPPTNNTNYRDLVTGFTYYNCTEEIINCGAFLTCVQNGKTYEKQCMTNIEKLP